MTETKNIGTMTAEELFDHIEETENKHRGLMKALRALQRARVAEEAMKEKGE